MEHSPTTEALSYVYSELRPPEYYKPVPTDNRQHLNFACNVSISKMTKSTPVRPLKLPSLKTSDKDDRVPQTVNFVGHSELEVAIELGNQSELPLGLPQPGLTITESVAEAYTMEDLTTQNTAGISGFLQLSPGGESPLTGLTDESKRLPCKQYSGILFGAYRDSYQLSYLHVASQKVHRLFELNKPHSMTVACGYLIWACNVDRSISYLKMSNPLMLNKASIQKSKFRLKHFVRTGKEITSCRSE